MTFADALALFVAALLAGALNSVAGGGSFISFPTLQFTGVDSIPANATNTLALWPGSISSVFAYKKEIAAHRRVIPLLGGVSIVGGIVGSLLLVNTPKTAFDLLIPWLLLFATLIFIFGGRVNKWLRSKSSPSQEGDSRARLGAVMALQLVISIYGGFFGGGIGILMLASLALMGLENIHTMNALKTLLAACINGVSVIIFVIAGLIYWPQAAVMIVAAIIGGYGGAYYAQKIDQKLVRNFVIVFAIGMTIFFFFKTYLIPLIAG